MSRVVGRVTLLAEVRRLLSQGRSVALAEQSLLCAYSGSGSGSGSFTLKYDVP